MLKIYGAPHSRTFRVIWLANEINLPYQHVPVTHDVSDAQCKQPWFLALNPNGRIPVIDDDGFVMWESAAINLYLAEKYKGPLYPNSLQGRGRICNGHSLFQIMSSHHSSICITIEYFIHPSNETLSLQTRRKKNCESRL